MTWAYVLRPREMATFRRCRRAWDFGARIRRNYVPARPQRVFDFDKAIHDALAVYYFPAMDDWDRAIVRPLALKGFLRSLEEDRTRYESVAEITPQQEEELEEAIERGEAMLNGYFAWAAPLDSFASIFSDQEYWAPIPDPDSPGSDLTNAAGREIRLLGRVDHLFSDHNDEYWIADHRVVGNEWEDDDQLLLDLEGMATLWATEQTYPQLRVAGTVYNELRVDAEPGSLGIEAADGFDAHVDARTMARPRHIHTRRSPPAAGGRGQVDGRPAATRLSHPIAGELQHLRLPGTVHRPDGGGRRHPDPRGVLPPPHRGGGGGGAPAVVGLPGPDPDVDEWQGLQAQHGQPPLGLSAGPAGVTWRTCARSRRRTSR